MEFTKREKDIMEGALELFKIQLKKLMKSAGSIGVAEKEIKNAFLETERLIGKLSEE